MIRLPPSGGADEALVIATRPSAVTVTRATARCQTCDCHAPATAPP